MLFENSGFQTHFNVSFVFSPKSRKVNPSKDHGKLSHPKILCNDVLFEGMKEKML